MKCNIGSMNFQTMRDDVAVIVEVDLKDLFICSLYCKMRMMGEYSFDVCILPNY